MNAIEHSEDAFEKSNSAESSREIDDGLMQKAQDCRTKSIWIALHIRRAVLDVIIARAIASYMLEDYSAMEFHVLNAIKKAGPLREMKLYESLQKRCQYVMGVALYYQQRFKDAADAFEKAKNCPAAPGISLRDAEEWRHVIKAALQAPQQSSFPEQREDISDSETTPTQERRTSVLALFPSRKLSNIDEEIEAGDSDNRSAARTAERPFEEALPSPADTPLLSSTDSWSFMPNVFQRKQSLKKSRSTRPNLLRNESIRSQFTSAFASGRSRAASITSMNEDEINAAFGGGGEYQSYKNRPGGFETPRESWASGYEREEIAVGDDDLRTQRWAKWEEMIQLEDNLFRKDEMKFVADIDRMRRKNEEQRKESGGMEDEGMTPAKEQKEGPEAKKGDFEAKKEKRSRIMKEGKMRLRIDQSAGSRAGEVR